MKLGFVSSIMDNWSFEEMMDDASNMGFQCVEASSWPSAEKAERRYAGVSHIDVAQMDPAKASYINEYCKNKNIEISSLAFYPNTLDGDLEKRKANIDHLIKVILASEMLNIGMVTTFIGRDQTKNIEDNLAIIKDVWPSIVTFAEQHHVKIAIENCPMLFGPDQWPGGQNIMTSPVLWDKIFNIIPNKNFGLNFDPSHFIWQKMDYIQAIYEFKDKMFHIHFKDMKIRYDILDRCGVLAYPLDYMIPKIPGLGDVDWSKFVSALTDVGYDGYACIEVEDRAFEGSKDNIRKALIQSKRYIEQFI